MKRAMVAALLAGMLAVPMAMPAAAQQTTVKVGVVVDITGGASSLAIGSFAPVIFSR